MSPEAPKPEAPKDTGSGMITGVPAELGVKTPEQPPAQPSREVFVSATSNSMRSPVLGRPKEMRVEEAHVKAREQYAAEAAAEAGQTAENQQ